ncbi:MAG: hypothetical protein FJY97_11895 [candidate division Zixibacteria bacterium]|nr:hypothetical protein [candidate division Zixibacteria bacterium]
MKYRWSLVAPFIAVFAVTQPDAVQAQGMEVTSAKVYMKENPPRLDKAAELLKTALEKDPKHTEAHFFLGMVNYYQGNFDGFFEHWNQVVYDKLSKAEKTQYVSQLKDMVRLRVGDTTKQYEAKKFDGAVKQAKAALKAIDMLHAVLKTSTKKEDVAAVTSLEANRTQSYLYMGFAANSAGMLEESAMALEKIVAADPKNFQAWDGLVNTYARQKDNDKLIGAANKSIELNPQPDKDTYLILRNAHFAKTDTASVLMTYERAITAFPTDYGLYRDLSSLYANARAYDKAATVLEKGNTNIPGNLDILGMLSAVYYNMGFVKQEAGDKMAAKEAFSKAVPILESLLQIEPKSIDGNDTMGKVYHGLGKVESNTAQQQALNAKGDEFIAKRRELIRTGVGK